MDRRRIDDSESRFAGYVEGLASVIGHKDREEPLRHYCTGLLMPCERKSVEPMAAITAPVRTAAQHQSLLHFIGEGQWSDEKVLAKVRELVLPQIERHGAIVAWIIDDTGFPKQGQHSVGVARQYCGQLGKQDNCQVAVSLSLANHHASLPVAYQLYLPQDWARTARADARQGCPRRSSSRPSHRLRLSSCAGRIRPGCCAASRCSTPAMATTRRCAVRSPRWDALCGRYFSHHGVDARHGAVAGVEARSGAAGRTTFAPQPQASAALRQSAGVTPTQIMPGAPSAGARARRTAVLALCPRAGAARRSATRYRRSAPRGMAADRMARGRKGADQILALNPAGKHLASALVDFAKLRWRIERDYQELKQEVGLGHFEGRGWRGFHHHATLCIAAYGFLISERETIPPSGPPRAGRFEEPTVSDNHRPRGAAIADRAPRSKFDRHHAPTPDHRLAKHLPRCPCCQRAMPARSQRRIL